MIDGAVPCHSCQSTELSWSFGALFGCASIFCTKCRCLGRSSETEPKEPDQKKRMAQALKNWNAGLFESTEGVEG